MLELDPQVLESIKGVPVSQSQQPGSQTLKLDPEVTKSIEQTDKDVKARRDYLRDKYAWGLVAPLDSIRQTYSKGVAKEVTDPTERQWLVEEVANIAKMQELSQQKEYGESGYLGRLGKNLQKVGGSFANAGAGMVSAAEKGRDWAQGRNKSPEDVKFLRALESAKQGENPYIPEDTGLAGKAATGAVGMLPDMAAGMAATIGGGPAGGMAYWTARQAPERREDYIDVGLNPTAAGAAGLTSSALEAAIEMINIDPTGLMKQTVAAPVKGMIRKGISKAAEKVGGDTLKSFVKHPITSRVVGAGVEAMKRTGLETLEEGLQGAVQEGGMYLASNDPQRTLGGVASSALDQAIQALPGIAVLGGVGGVVQAGGAVKRFGQIAEGTKHARIRSEIMQVDSEGIIPSREQWKKWGLPAEEGRSRTNRREVAGQLAEGYRNLEQIRAVLSGVTPTESQWKQLGLPAEEGGTEEARKAYLQKKFMPEPAAQQVTQEVVEPEGLQTSAIPPGESLATEQSTIQQSAANSKTLSDEFIKRATESTFYGKPKPIPLGVELRDKLPPYLQTDFDSLPEQIQREHGIASVVRGITTNREVTQEGDGARYDQNQNALLIEHGTDIQQQREAFRNEAIASWAFYHNDQQLYAEWHKAAFPKGTVVKEGFHYPDAADSFARSMERWLNGNSSDAENSFFDKHFSSYEQQGLQSDESTQEASGFQPVHHDFPVEMEGTGERSSGREIVRQIEKIWDIPIRSGRIRSSKARGIYKTYRHVSRLARGEESSTAVAIHEVIGHHFDNTTDVLKKAPAEAKVELGALDYDQTKQRAGEGFAEFVRAYLTGATETHKQGIDLPNVAPKFLAYFEGWLDSHPDYKAKMEATRAPMEAYKRAGAVGRVKGQISETGIDRGAGAPLTKWIHEAAERVYTRFKDEGRPVSRFTNEAIKRGYDPSKDRRGNVRTVADTTPWEDYKSLRQVGPAFAQTAIEHGVFRLTGNRDKIGPSLREALKEINEGEDYQNFLAWTYARHAIESWQKGKNPGITLEDAKEASNRLYDKRYEKAADAVTQFNNALIHVLADVGAIDYETATKIRDYYKTYIPLERAKESGGLGGSGRKMVDLSAAIKGRHGSGLQIIDPIESTLARAIRIYERAAQQVVTNKLIQVATDVKGLGGWVEEVPKKVMAEHFSFAQIKDQVGAAIQEALGADPQYILDAIDPMTAMMIWRPDLMKVHGAPIVRVTVNGQPKFYQLHPELAEALGGLETIQHLDVATRTARAITGLQKRGATRLNPDFILSNAVRDFDTFILQGEKGLKGAFDPAQYASAYILSELRAASGEKGNPVVDLFHSMGGDLSTYAGLDRARLRGGVKRVLRGGQGKIETAMNIAGVTEVAPRIAEFASILEKEGWLERVKAGETPPMQVLTRAINAAHDVTIDFRRMGKWGRYINYWVPFFNARLEGSDKFFRTFKDHPTRSLLRAAQWIATRSLIYWWLRHDDDDYKERPEWQDGFYILKDNQGNPIARIPKSQEWGLIGSGVERMLDAMYDKDPEPVERWFKQAVGTLNPGELPTAFLLPAETMFNYDAFRNRPIVSASKQKLEAPDQSYDYTSGIANGVARWLHDKSGGSVSLSPAKIDHLANGITGGLYGKATSYTEFGAKLAAGKGVRLDEIPALKGLTLRKDYPKSIDDFYSAKESLDRAHNSGKLSGKPDKNIDTWRRAGYVSALMTDMRSATRGLSDADKTKADLAMTGLARTVLGRAPLQRYRNPLADLSTVPDGVREVVEKHIAQKAATASGKSDEADNAAQYLRDMGVSEDTARELAYDRLRGQGVKVDTAKQRARRIMW